MDYEIDKWDLEDFDETPLNKKNKKDVRMAKEHCEEHEMLYSKHKCKPIWDRKTGELQIYEIDVYAKKEKD
tara:strand:+ start:2527 stop:2739 length:213 start_codon:yes stop_codon:yes gene_type:complete